MSLFVTLRENRLHLGGFTAPIRSGMGGFAPFEKGREGDKKTPLGQYHLRFGLYRADRLPSPPPKHTVRPLNFRPLRPDDGWCDAAGDAAYNRFVKLPYPASHEALWRKDGAYDIILVMNHNDSPPMQGLGSAVFFHVAQSDDRKTLGCVALAPDDMVRLLPRLQRDMLVTIQE